MVLLLGNGTVAVTIREALLLLHPSPVPPTWGDVLVAGTLGLTAVLVAIWATPPPQEEGSK